MKSLLTLSLLCYSVLNCLSQPQLEWEDSYTRGNSSDRGNAITLDQSGNVYVTGYSLTSTTNKDIIIIKYDGETGDTLWWRTYDHAFHGVDEGIALITDDNNDVYITGTVQRSSTTSDIITLKYDSLGNRQWVAINNGTSNNRDDVGLDIKIDQLYNVYVAGRSNFNGKIIKYNSQGGELWSKVAFDIENVEFNSAGNILTISGDDARIHEFEPNGNIIYSFNGIGNITTSDVIVTTDNIYIHGVEYSGDIPLSVGVYRFTNGIPDGIMLGGWNVWNCGGCTLNGAGFGLDLDQNSYSVMSFYDASDYNFFICKRSPTGDTIWTREYGNESSNEIPVASVIKRTQNPDIYIVGYTSTNNIITLKYDAFGNLKWQTTYDCGNAMTDIPKALIADGRNNLFLTGYSNCNGNNDDVKTLKYCIDPPQTPGNITYNNPICIGSSVQFSVPLDTSVESYTWILPNGWTGTSVTNSILATVGESGTISVVANGISCSSGTQILPVTVNSIPAQPIQILGDNTVCSGSNQIFSTQMVPDATSYIWNLPADWTGNSDTNSINVTTGNNSGAIILSAVNVCGASVTQTLNVTVSSSPSAPQEIFGDTILCEGQASSYSITGVPNANDYIWTLPGDWFTPDNTGLSINVIPGQSGSISVVALNGECPSEPIETAIEILSHPTPLTTIVGDNSLCINDQVLYFLANAGPNLEFHWTLPNGMTQQTTSGSILVTGDVTGLLQVYSQNMCGVSNTISLPIQIDSEIPTQPVLLSNITSACVNDVIQITLEEHSDTDSIHWLLPSGWTGSSQSEEITIGVNNTSGTIHVFGINSCGISSGLDIPITIIDLDSTIENHDSYLVANENLPGTTYQWFDCINQLSLPDSVNSVLTPSISGFYKVQISNQGCTTFSNCEFVMVTSIKEVLDNTIEVYPNPTYGNVAINSKGKAINEISIYNSIGQQIFNTKDKISNPINLDLNQYSSGIYLVFIRTGNFWAIDKLIKI